MFHSLLIFLSFTFDIQLLRPEEVETLVIGNPDFNIKDLEKITKYDGFKRTDATIRYGTL